MGLIRSLPLIVILMGIAGCASFVPGLHAFAIRDYAVGRAFVYAGLVMLFLAAMLAIVTHGRPAPSRLRGPLIALLASYVVLPVWMTLPLLWAVPGTTFVTGWFEMVSAFTTTGATLWPPEAPLAASVHLWRAMVGWGGGAFILIAAAAILSPLNLGGREIINVGSIGQSGERGTSARLATDPVRRFLGAAATVLPSFVGLTALLWSGLIILGSPGLEGLCIAMSTLATSGITCGQSVATNAAGVMGEVAVFLFLIIALSRRFLPGPAITDRNVPLWSDPELRLAVVILVVVPLALLIRQIVGAYGATAPGQTSAPLAAVWGGLFSTMSFLTTTGFGSASWEQTRAWSGMTTPGLVFLGLAIFGGGVATTAGGVKLLRVHALVRHGQRELERVIHPNSVGGDGKAARRLRREGAIFAWVFFMLFAISIMVLMLGLSMTGMSFQAALVLTIAAMTTTGPLVTFAAETPIDLGAIGMAAQILAGMGMILGRIEILALIALLSLGDQRR